MTKPTLPNIDWFGEGWRAWAILKAVPQLGLLSKHEPLSAETISDLEALQDRLVQFVNYTLYRRRPKTLPLKRGRRFTICGRLPQASTGMLKFFKDTLGFEFTTNEVAAFYSHGMIGDILVGENATSQIRETLPLLVASVAGQGVHFAAHKAASAKRGKADRRSKLRCELERCIRNHPGETAFSILHRLAGERVVEKSDGSRVWYRTKEGELKEIGIDRYENVFSEAKRSIDTANRDRQSARRSTG